MTLIVDGVVFVSLVLGVFSSREEALCAVQERVGSWETACVERGSCLIRFSLAGAFSLSLFDFRNAVGLWISTRPLRADGLETRCWGTCCRDKVEYL